MDIEKITELFKSIKDNPTVIIGLVFASIGTIASGSYVMITKYNEISAIVTGFDGVQGDAASALKKIDLLAQKVESIESRVNSLGDTLNKVQDKTSEALLAGRQGQTVAESTRTETRSQIQAIKSEVQIALDAVKTEMNALRKATTNRLGN